MVFEFSTEDERRPMGMCRALVLGAICFMVFFALPAQAMGNIHFGKLAIHPYLSLQEIFSDNIYYTATDQKRDRIAQITPGAQLQFPFGVHRLEADYHAVLRRHDTYRGENTDDHHARGRLDLLFGSRFALNLGGKFDKDHEGRASSATGFIETFRRNEASASAIYHLAGRSKVQIDYQQTSYNFMVSDFRDRDEDLVAGYVYYRFLPKTSAFVEVDRRNVDYIETTSTLDSTMLYMLFGVTWEATAKSKGTIKAGRVSKDFEDAALKDIDEGVLFVDIDHKFTEYTSILLSAKRDVNEASLQGTSYYITTGFSGEFKHRFWAKFAGLARLSYGRDDFSNAVPPYTMTRKDNAMMEGIGIQYSPQDWLEVGANYNYRSRDSNIDVNDYREHQATVSINMVF